ncbi:MAG: GTPase HflX [Pseudomonadota bacterium]
MTRTLVLHPALRGDVTAEEAEARLDEGTSLTRALDVDLAGGEIVWLARPHPATLMGSGKVDELATRIHADHVDLLVIDGTLSPVQQRNLERDLKTKVLDRTGLILEIFGDRAQTREGVLQVDLAHLSYQKSRLVRSWTHLERQRGGAGFMGGPGERQIESDRRQLDGRIAALRRQLDKVVKTRTLHRAARAKVPHPIVALVGYTNAGKSTLFNRLTEADVMAKDMLFATLDPTMREITLPSGRTAIMSDTVGFISDLPTQLVAAFRATLEEVLEADLLVHVRDISSPRTDAQSRDVVSVLTDLGVAQDRLDRTIEAWNKTDLLDADAAETVTNRAERADNTLLISAHDGTGCDALLAEIETKLFPARHVLDLTLPHEAGRAVAWLHARGDVTSRMDDQNGVHLNVELTDREYFQFRKQFPEVFPDAPPDRQAAE